MTEITLRDNLYGFEQRDTDNRRVPSEERATYNIKQLWQRSHEIINLCVKGFSNVQIAKLLGVTPECVSQTINSDLGKHKIADLRKLRDEEAREVSEKIRILTNKALETYHEIFDSDHATLKEKKSVADTVMLELSGLRVPTKIQSHSMHTTLTPEEIEAFKKRGLEIARQSNLLITQEESDECTS